MASKRVIVVGTGPGGGTAAMVLAKHGFEVEIFEKQPYVGGRTSAVHLGDYTFDLGPTFLMMVDVLENAFRAAGRDVHEYLDIRRIEPMYHLRFGDGRSFYPTTDPMGMKAEIERLFPGQSGRFDRYMTYEQRKYDRVLPCLQVPYDELTAYASKRFLRAIPYLDAHRNLFDHLGRYFDHEDLKISFTFQAKYLGMSPWKCPATFSIISFIEHSGGIYHVIGGLNRITAAMAKVAQEHGARLHLGTGVKRLLLEGRRAVGVELDSGEQVRADHVVVNADFGTFMTRLVPHTAARKYTPAKLSKMGLSCSGFMLYLAVDKQYDLAHHNILFSQDYKQNVTEIADTLQLSDDPSVYVQNASHTDPTLAPPGCSTLYVLVPAPNRRSGIDWSEAKAEYRERVLRILEQKAGLTDLRQHIVAERVVTPDDFETDKLVYQGAVFNLAHTVGQMLWMRPHNKFEEFAGCWLAGGGTHPGSGLPTIIQSGVISAEGILAQEGAQPGAPGPSAGATP